MDRCGDINPGNAPAILKASEKALKAYNKLSKPARAKLDSPGSLGEFSRIECQTHQQMSVPGTYKDDLNTRLDRCKFLIEQGES